MRRFRRLVGISILVFVAVVISFHLMGLPSLSLLGTTIQTSPSSDIQQPPNQMQLSDFAQRVLSRTNDYRAQFGCPPLVLNSILMGTAQEHSDEMVLHDFVGHQSFDGTTPWDRIYHAGYHYSLVAENVAWGQTTPEQVVDVWFNETPPNDLHRQNILNCQLHDMGLGYAYIADLNGRKIQAHTYWTQDFGKVFT